MNNEQKKPLFSEFATISSEEWRHKIISDLKGAEYSRLEWKPLEGFRVQPFYRAEDLNTNHFLRATHNDWEIRQTLSVANPSELNARILNYLNRGLSSVSIHLDVIDSIEFDTIFEDVLCDILPVHFVSKHYALQAYAAFISFAKSKGYNLTELRGSVNFDFFSEGLLSGKLNTDVELLADTLRFAHTTTPQFRVVQVHGETFHNSGATAVQELAFTMAQGVEYLHLLGEKGLSVDDIAPHLTFSFGVGGTYFMEIAKLRAARVLWASIIEIYQPKNKSSKQLFIHAEGSGWNKTIYDPHVNMLRSTTEGMSAAIAGADSIALNNFDEAYKNSDEFSERISRNAQLVLKGEAYLDKIVDPSAGSYYIEELTSTLVQEALSLFQEIETNGGFISLIQSGRIQTELKNTAHTRDMNLALRKELLLGTNQYPNASEKMADKCVAKHVFIPREKCSEAFTSFKKLQEYLETKSFFNEEKVTIKIKPLHLYRGAEAFENLRLTTEKSRKIPSVFLVQMGHLAMRKARANFALNFFACAGFDVQETNGFSSIDQAVEAAKGSVADIIVLCSSDEEYAEWGELLTKKLKSVLPNSTVIIAGFPKDAITKLEAAGVDEFIHMKSNVLEILTKYQTEYFTNE